MPTNWSRKLLKGVPYFIGCILFGLCLTSVYGYFTVHGKQSDKVRAWHIEQIAQALRGYLRDTPEGSSAWPDLFVAGDGYGQVTCDGVAVDIFDSALFLEPYLAIFPTDPVVADPEISMYAFSRTQSGWEIYGCEHFGERVIREIVSLSVDG